MSTKESGSGSWLVPPAFFFAGLAMLLLTWGIMTPSSLMAAFDADGRSCFELATLPVFAAIVPAVWLACPFGGTALRRRTLCAMVTVVVAMAIVKELDLHNAALHSLYPTLVGEDGSLLPGLFKPNGKPLTGTPFKMRVLTNGAVPLTMKALIVFYFASFFGLFAAGFAYLAPAWLKGVFALKPAAWAVGCMCGSGVVVQLADRLPAWLKHATGEKMAGAGDSSRALCTALEEGFEMMLAVFALMAIAYGWRSLRRKEGE